MAKNLNEIFKRRKRIVKVVEDVEARKSICSSIAESMGSSIDFYGIKDSTKEVVEESLSSDIISGGIEESTIVEQKERINKVKQFTNLNLPIDNNKLDTPVEQEERINKVKQFTNLNLPIDNNKLDTYLTLPKDLLRLSKIFKGLSTVQKYNENRKLSSIFIKSKGCIERTLRTRVEEEDVKKILYLNGIECKDLTVEEKGQFVKTFTFKLKCTGEEFDKRLMGFYKEGGEFNLEQEKEEIVKEENNKSPVVKENVSKRTTSVLERIREKEAKRKEEFIKKMKIKNDERDLIKRLETLFKKESKKAIKIKEIVKVLEIFNGIVLISRIVENHPEEFEIKKISGEDFLVKR